MEEYKHAKAHYMKLGLGERIELDLHEGGHEIRLVGTKVPEKMAGCRNIGTR